MDGIIEKLSDTDSIIDEIVSDDEISSIAGEHDIDEALADMDMYQTQFSADQELALRDKIAKYTFFPQTFNAQKNI